MGHNLWPNFWVSIPRMKSLLWQMRQYNKEGDSSQQSFGPNSAWVDVQRRRLSGRRTPLQSNVLKVENPRELCLNMFSGLLTKANLEFVRPKTYIFAHLLHVCALQKLRFFASIVPQSSRKTNVLKISIISIMLIKGFI